MHHLPSIIDQLAGLPDGSEVDSLDLEGLVVLSTTKRPAARGPFLPIAEGPGLDCWQAVFQGFDHWNIKVSASTVAKVWAALAKVDRYKLGTRYVKGGYLRRGRPMRSSILCKAAEAVDPDRFDPEVRVALIAARRYRQAAEV